MSIQQNVNQILSLSAVFARMSPLADIAEHRKDVENAKKAYDQQNKLLEDILQHNEIDSTETYKNVQDAAKRLYQIEPTEELAQDINLGDTILRKREQRAAQAAAEHSMQVEKARQDADRAREARLKILEGVSLSKESETYTKKLLESNTPAGKPLKEKKPKREETK